MQFGQHELTQSTDNKNCKQVFVPTHYDDVIIIVMASRITSLTVVYTTFYSGRSKKTSKLHVTGLCAANSSATGEFPAQMAIYAANVSI